MAKSLEEYVAQSTQAYQPAQNAIQSQLGSLESQLNTTNDTINRNYAQQQAQLESQRNQAAEASSLAAAGSGGSFGGAGNIARRKYYEQTFVPAQTQLQTNQANDLAQARQNYENQRTSLNSQLANLQAQANQQALQQYWAEQEAERNRQAQLAASRANNVGQYLNNAEQNSNQTGNKAWDFGDGYTLIQGNDGRSYYTKDGNQISAGAFLTGTGTKGTNWDLWNDVWNNGVNTYGVGSNTVDAFGYSPLKAKQLNNYNDLFVM